MFRMTDRRIRKRITDKRTTERMDLHGDRYACAPAETDSQKISDISQQLSEAVILPGIDHRIKHRQVHIEEIPA